MDREDKEGYQISSVMPISPGYYIVAIHQTYAVDNTDYMVAITSQDDPLDPLGFTVSVEDVGTYAEFKEAQEAALEKPMPKSKPSAPPRASIVFK